MTSSAPLIVAVLGTGPVGRTLATGWAAAGHSVVLGSRTPGGSRMNEIAAEVSTSSGGTVSVAAHVEAASAADVVVICVPGEQVRSLVAEIGPALLGRTVVDTTNNTAPSAASMSAIADLGAVGARPSRAFNTVGWEQMSRPVFGDIRADMPYTAGDADRPVMERLISDIGFRPIHLGNDEQALDAVDALARLWFLLAFRRGYGRRLGLRVLTAADDA